MTETKTVSLKSITKKALSSFGYQLVRIPRELKLGLDIIEQKQVVGGQNAATSHLSQGDLEAWFRKNEPVNIYKWAHYFEIYQRHLAPFRGKPVRVLEIGVYKGGTLPMWKSYFGDDSTIVGLDIDPACKKFENTNLKIHVRIGDQESDEFLESVSKELGPFDVVIDDGGHTTGQQIQSFLHLYFSAMKADGIYIVEDLHTNYWPEYFTHASGLTFVDLAGQLVHRLNDVYLGRGKEFARFDANNIDRFQTLAVSNFCAQSRSIHFYDSVIVFERGIKKIPYCERR